MAFYKLHCPVIFIQLQALTYYQINVVFAMLMPNSLIFMFLTFCSSYIIYLTLANFELSFDFFSMHRLILITFVMQTHTKKAPSQNPSTDTFDEVVAALEPPPYGTNNAVCTVVHLLL